MGGDVHTIAMEHEIPEGALGPDPVILDVRAYLVPHPRGFVLVDTGMDPSAAALDAALEQLGAAWSDVSHVLLTHGHADHVGGLEQVRRAARTARAFAHPAEELPRTAALGDGDEVGSLRVLATPGHTAGHVSFLDEGRAVLLVGDCLGTVDGHLVRGPERFTADPALAERSLHRLLAFRGARMLFGHGPEVADPWADLEALLDP